MPFAVQTLPALIALAAVGVPAQTLTVGSKAPPLEVTAYLRGEPVELGEGNVAVVEFWATWCPSCQHAIPLLSKLQRTFRSDGVRVVAVASSRFDSTRAKVESFVSDWNGRIAFAVAWDGQQAATRAWLDASRETSYPVAFVVDREGRVAWIGNPLEDLTESLPRVLDETFDIEVARKASGLQRDLGRAKAKRDRAGVLAITEAWIALEPSRARPWIERFRTLAADLNATQAAIECAREALAALTKSPRELARFANDGLFAERQATECHALGLEALRDARATDESNPDLGVAFFMALAATGRHDDAARVAAETVRAAGADAHVLCGLAQDFVQPRFRGQYAPQALEALARAAEAAPGDVQIDLLEFKIRALITDDRKGANEVGMRLVHKANKDLQLLNYFAWDLLDRPAFAGRFNELALAASEAVHAQEGGKHWMFLDTLARAKFVNGDVRSALKLQQQAVEECDHIGFAGDLRQRLEDYRAAAKRRD